MMRCYKCGWEWKERKQVPAVREVCPRCEMFLHCCMNCSLYSPTASNQCLSSTTDPVRDKERGNFCEEFRFKQVQPPPEAVKPKPARPQSETPRPPSSLKSEESRSSGSSKSSREKWEELFGGK